MNVLDGLPLVQWPRLHHAYGPADDVPDLLRALVEPDMATAAIHGAATRAGRSISDHVKWVLWGNVFHQGTRWQVTASVVPYLVEILRDGPDAIGLRRFLITYLHHLAMGYPEDAFPDRFNPDEAFRQFEGLSDPGGEPDYENESLVGVWARDTYVAVEEAIDTIAPFIEADDQPTALEAIALLASFPRCAGATVPPLQGVVRSGGGQRAAHALVSLAQLTGADALEDAERLVGATDRSVCTTAACAAVLSAPCQASTRAVEVLATPLGDIAKERSTHAGTLTQLVGRCLALLPDNHRDRAIDAIALQHRAASPLERVSLTASLLALAFNGQRAPRLASDLTAPQRRAVEAIREYGAFMIEGAHFANYGLLIRGAGLPDSAVGLGRWLGVQAVEKTDKARGRSWKFWKRQ